MWKLWKLSHFNATEWKNKLSQEVAGNHTYTHIDVFPVYDKTVEVLLKSCSDCMQTIVSDRSTGFMILILFWQQWFLAPYSHESLNVSKLNIKEYNQFEAECDPASRLFSYYIHSNFMNSRVKFIFWILFSAHVLAVSDPGQKQAAQLCVINPKELILHGKLWDISPENNFSGCDWRVSSSNA